MDISGDQIALWGTLTIFNVAIYALLRATLKNVNFNAALVDKDALTAARSASAAAAALAPQPGPGAVALAQTPQPALIASADYTSASRIAVMTGMTVLACLLWAVGNVTLYKGFANVEEAGKLARGMGPLFLAGAALFAPYAFNQLKSAF